METAGHQVGQLETRLRQLGARLDKLVAKAEQAGTELKVDYDKQLALAKDKRAVVRERLDAYKAANGQKWDSFKDGVESAWCELENAFKSLKQ